MKSVQQNQFLNRGFKNENKFETKCHYSIASLQSFGSNQTFFLRKNIKKKVKTTKNIFFCFYFFIWDYRKFIITITTKLWAFFNHILIMISSSLKIGEMLSEKDMSEKLIYTSPVSWQTQTMKFFKFKLIKFLL